MNGLAKIKVFVGGVIMAGAMGFAATASATVIDGINLPAGSGFNSSNGYETLASGTGQTVTGWGFVNSFNNNQSYCANGSVAGPGGCQLTYYFTADVSYYNPASAGSQIILDNVQAYFYSNSTYTYDPSATSYTAANVTDGSLWLQASGHTSVNQYGQIGEIFGSTVGSTAVSYSGFGGGLLDATGGAAQNYFLPTFSDGLPNGSLADFLLALTYNHVAGNENQQNEVITANYQAVPEPSDLGMMGLGLLMVGLMGLRFRQSRFRRD